VNLFSVESIKWTPPDELGSGGFCFVVAEILKARFPASVLYRLTDLNRTYYTHVFRAVGGAYVDIKGFRKLIDLKFDHPNNSQLVEAIDEENVRKHFYPCYQKKEDREALSAARAKLRLYIDSNPAIFTR
jgi:hypothetical protein